MEFLKHCDNKNIVMECSEDMVVSEGWGAVLTKVLGGPIGLAVGDYINSKKVKKMITDPKMAQYIKGECERILKEQQEDDSSITKELSGSGWQQAKAILTSKGENSTKGFIDNMKYWKKIYSPFDEIGEAIGGFRIDVLADNSHIQKVVLWLYSKDKEKYLLFNVPAPSDEELSKIFHKE